RRRARAIPRGVLGRPDPRAAARPGAGIPRACRGDPARRHRAPRRGPGAASRPRRRGTTLRHVRPTSHLRPHRSGERPVMSHPFTFDPLPQPVVGPGEFAFAAVGLDHGHIYGMTDGLIGAGATVTWVFDRDSEKAASFAQRYPSARVASSEQQILDDPEVRL